MSASSIIIDKILQILEEIGARTILDVGCGSGTLSKLLSDKGYDVTGIEPLEEALEKARANAPEASFINTGAENIPCEDGQFDAVILLNAFHHIPPNLMEKALAQFARILKKQAQLIIAEPLSRGSFFEAMRPVEDETEIRNYALQVLQQASRNGAWKQISSLELDRESTFNTVDQFVEALIAVDPERQPAAQKNKQEISRLFLKHATRSEDQFKLVQPHIILRLTPSDF